VRPATEVTIRAGREPVAGLFDIEDTVALCVGCFGERPAGAPPPPTPPEPDKPCVKCGSRDRYIKTGKCRPCSHQRYRRRALAAAAAMRAAP
jgi:hypothetical protein